MHSWRSSAAYRIAFISFAANALGIAALGVVIFAAMHIAFTQQLDSMISDDAQTLVDEFRKGGIHELSTEIAERETAASPTRMLYAVYARDGRRILGTLRAKRPETGMRRIPFFDPSEGNDEARAMSVDASPDIRIVVAVDDDWVDRSDEIVIVVFGIAFLGTFLLGFGGEVILGGYLERRLRSISRSAEAIIGGDTRKRMPVSERHDEFDQLAMTLNRMLDRIEGLLENLRQVSSDVAHDLRTPLSRLRTRLEQGILDHPDRDEAEAILQDAVQRIDDVLLRFAAILRIAEVESGETRRYFAPVDLSALAIELAESFAPSVEEDRRTLLWSIEPGIRVEGDRELLAQAFINLLENAQRHTPVGTVIRMTLVAAGKLASISVVDNGPGVPKAELSRVTKRFARLESSRNTAGYGLGLSLVKAVARLHRGSLILKNANPGLSVTMELPRMAIRSSAEEPDKMMEESAG
jgi:signal transduction histidine kinase